MRASPRRYLWGGLLTGLALVGLAWGGLHLAGYRLMLHEVPTPASPEKAGKKIICYRSPQDPKYLSDIPGTDPQGNELVPVYEGELEMAAKPAIPAPAPAKKERKIKYWVSPMEPDYIRDKPGKAPCGMDLVPVYEDEGEAQGEGTISVPGNILQTMGVRTAKVEKRELSRVIRAVGKVMMDERGLAVITTKVNGWVERLYVNATGDPVRRGQSLLSIYSPELVSAQEEYLLARRNLKSQEQSPFPELAQSARRLAEASRKRLQYWDIGAAQIDALERTGQVKKNLVLTSPVNGIVIQRMGVEGMYVRAGAPLLEVADLSKVWVEAEVYEYELPWLKLGQEAVMTLNYLPGETFKGRVEYIYPYLDGKTRTARVRLIFANPGLKLKPEMFAQVEIQSPLPEATVAVPTEAVIDTGSKQHVFVALGQGRFAPREVKLGLEAAGGWRQVLSGLSGGEDVVTSAQFLLDSESRFREAAAMFLKGSGEGSDKPAAPPAGTHHH